MDNIFYIKNLAYAKCVELEEKILEREEEHERLQELDGL